MICSYILVSFDANIMLQMIFDKDNILRDCVFIILSISCIFYVQMRTVQFIQFKSVILGGGSEAEGELIEVVELSIPELKDYIKSDEVTSPSSFLFGISWFLLNKPEHCS